MNDEVEELEVIIKKIKYKDIIWIPEQTRPHNDKENYFVKWMQKYKPGDVFNIEEFYKKYPKHKTDMGCKRRVEKIISNLIKDGKIDMWTTKNKFRVLKI